jgi:hypothetical protein
MAIRPNKPARGFAALGTAAPVDGVVLAFPADSVAVPEGAAASADWADAEGEDVALLGALTRVLALALALVVSLVPLALAVVSAVAVVVKTSTPPPSAPSPL